MAWVVSRVSLRQQYRGPIRNVIVSVAAIETQKRQEHRQSVVFTVDEKITVFFKFDFIQGRELILLPFVCVKATEGTQNYQVEITCQEFRKITSCCEEYIKVQLNGVKYYDRDRMQYERIYYTIMVNITVHENISMPIHTKLYEDTEFTDFKLKASDGAVAVHKSILAFQSDMFKTMLKGEWKETVEGCINIDGVTMETLQRLKDYMYLGTIPDEGLEALILLAEHYLMDKLKSACIAKLVRSVNPENFDSIIKFAFQSSIPEELVLALICGIPDDVASSVYQLKNSKK